MKTIGRKREIEQLDRLCSSEKSEFIAVYGRRRVGKTYLIRAYFQQEFAFHLTGLANANTQQQLTNFHSTLVRQRSPEFAGQVPENWLEAFQKLIDHIEAISTKGKKVVFLDELPWLDTPRSDFIMALEHFWNSWASNRTDIVLVTCGSAASWMLNQLINNRGGLHNRVTARIKMHPFTLKETEELLKDRGNVLDRYQIIQLYMVMGGIPFYLDAVSPGMSAAQNIEALCFRRGALLVTEFKNLFASLFKKPEKYEKVIIALSSKRKGMTRNELSKKSGLSTGGGLTRILQELEESGFISSYSPFDKKIRNTIYRLSDFYSLFYIKFIQDNRNFEEGVWLNAIDAPAHRAWSGYTFEQVCMTHIPQIKKALGISGVQSESSSWTSTSSEKGAQIDLLIDRRDQVVNICEIKYSIGPFQINKSYADILRNKLSFFKQETATRKSVHLTMITTYGLKENEYARSMVQNEISMDALFEG